ncbi:hypothetical protein PQU94_09045 [Asticcacaulis sp. DXS10W]|uniref:Uncharacterized protein n=1 Tax=Asticcacaulis currens TaxID=2984210 RepID=A0ABT5IE06_9CAUL|nr:hypothetical protein [Asticcacaulis currens]MDC7694426.1 hypothetical protein [Asticcacaulis currens]
MPTKLEGPGGGIYHTISDEITVCVGEEHNSIQLKAVSSFGDPVDLGEGEVEELIELLQALLEKIR